MLTQLLTQLRDKIDNDYCDRIDSASMARVDDLHARAIERLNTIDAVIQWAQDYEVGSTKLAADTAERLLLDLTPGGSEYHGSPERCAQWARDRIRMTGKIAAERNRLRIAADALAVGVDELLEMLEDDELTPSSVLEPVRILLREYRETK